MPTSANIPVIDISDPNVDQAELASRLVDAAVEQGFIYIRNLGKDIPVADIDGAFALVSMRPFSHWQRMETRSLTNHALNMTIVQEDLRQPGRGEEEMHNSDKQPRMVGHAL